MVFSVLCSDLYTRCALTYSRRTFFTWIVEIIPSASNLSVHIPTVVEVVNPVKVWKSSLSWQISSEVLVTVKAQVPVEVGVKELGKLKSPIIKKTLSRYCLLCIPDIAGVGGHCWPAGGHSDQAWHGPLIKSSSWWWSYLQQTPNPAAQLPSAAPLFSSHSVAV